LHNELSDWGRIRTRIGIHKTVDSLGVPGNVESGPATKRWAH